MELRTYLVYETRTGRIAHTVYVDIMKGAQMPSETEIEKEVMTSATHVTGIAKETLSLLSIGTDRMKPGVLYEIDPKTRNLIMKERPPRHKSSPTPSRTGTKPTRKKT
jgi:hypothetical protein